MKVYEKPKLVMMSISGNDLLCSCKVDVVGSNANPDYLQTIALLIEMGFSENALFDEGSCTTPVSGYCKMNSASIIVNS